MRWFGTLMQTGTAAILLRDAEVAADLCELTAPIAHYYSGDGSGAVFSHGANARQVGELALTAGRPAAAVQHLRDAVTMNARIGARPHTALSRLGLAKLNFSTRTEIATWVLRTTPSPPTTAPERCNQQCAS